MNSLLCKQCGKSFVPRNKLQKCCCEKCGDNYRNHLPGNHVCGPCPTCGKTFLSKTSNKKYCSINCYTKSDFFKKMQSENLQKMNPTMGTPKICPECKMEFSRSKRSKFCSKICMRNYFSNRFDRWIANPETVALPQNYDEFLSRNILPCPVDGCEWSGKHLSCHVNKAHGITAKEFKKLCGFNIHSGLISKDLSEQFIEKAKKFTKEGIWPKHPDVLAVKKGIENRKNTEKYVSLEAIEHIKKSYSLSEKLGDGLVFCKQCGAEYRRPKFGRKLYCSIRCRNRYYYQKSKI